MGHWNGYAYDSPSATRVRRTRRDRTCIHCKRPIPRGREYTCWHGYAGMAEHYPECPTKREGGE
jgi:hypothetical protein